MHPMQEPQSSLLCAAAGLGSQLPQWPSLPSPSLVLPAPCTSTALPCYRLWTNPELTTLLEHMSTQHGIQFIY